MGLRHAGGLFAGAGAAGVEAGVWVCAVIRGARVGDG